MAKTGYNSAFVSAKLPNNNAQDAIRILVASLSSANMPEKADMSAIFTQYTTTLVPAAWQDWSVYLLKLRRAMKQAKANFESVTGAQLALDKQADDFWKSILRGLVNGALAAFVSAVPIPGVAGAATSIATFAIAPIANGIKYAMALSGAKKNLAASEVPDTQPGDFFSQLLAAETETDAKQVLQNQTMAMAAAVARLSAMAFGLAWRQELARRIVKAWAFEPFFQCPGAVDVRGFDVVTWAADLELRMWANYLVGFKGTAKGGVAKAFGKALGTGLLDTASSSGGNMFTAPIYGTSTDPNIVRGDPFGTQQSIPGTFAPSAVSTGVADAIFNAVSAGKKASQAGKARDPGLAIRTRLRQYGYGRGTNDTTYMGKLLKDIVGMKSEGSAEQVKQFNKGRLSSSHFFADSKSDYESLYTWAGAYAGGNGGIYALPSIGPQCFVDPDTDQFRKSILAYIPALWAHNFAVKKGHSV